MVWRESHTESITVALDNYLVLGILAQVWRLQDEVESSLQFGLFFCWLHLQPSIHSSLNRSTHWSRIRHRFKLRIKFRSAPKRALKLVRTAQAMKNLPKNLCKIVLPHHRFDDHDDIDDDDWLIHYSFWSRWRNRDIILFLILTVYPNCTNFKSPFTVSLQKNNWK